MIHILDVEAAGSNEIPPCVRDVILQQLQSPRPPTNPKMMRKLSKTINLPDDPSDPTAFTVFHDHPMYYNVPKYKSRSKRSRQVAKIVGTFSFLMTMGIVITVLCFLCKLLLNFLFRKIYFYPGRYKKSKSVIDIRGFLKLLLFLFLKL